MAIERKGREQPRGKRVRERPKKPYPDFPLFPHATGRWAKKIRGRFAFFGPWEDPLGALDRYVAQRDDLYAGRVPRLTSGVRTPQTATSPATNGNGVTAAGLTIRDLVNHFLTSKQRRLESGELSKRAFSDYYTACRLLVDGVGLHRLATELTPEDFGAFRAKLAKTRGPVALGNQVNRIRSVFKYGYDADLLEAPVRFGPEFVRPTMRVVRLARQAKGPLLFERDEIRLLLDEAGTAMRAMIFLGINCGLGNTDIAELPIAALDLKTRILVFPRPKTGIARRCVLWDETVKAISEYLKERKEPTRQEDRSVLFITKYGQRFVRVQEPGERSRGKTQAVLSDGIGLQFGKLMRGTQIYRRGRSFYALRHTFRTVADEVGDRRAVDLCMGHEPGGDIATSYVERVGDDRLKRVARHLRKWLFGPPNRRSRSSQRE